MPKIINILIFSFAVVALGCDEEDKLNCETVMVCEQDKEMYCYEMENGCVDECHYWVFENCFEVCKHDR